MNKKNEIIRLYTEAEGHATAKQITDTLTNEGVKVTYNYVTMVIRSYKQSINDNYNKVINNNSDSINDTINNNIDSINDNYKKVITMLSLIITKLSKLEAALDPCNTRARLSTYTRCTEGKSLENKKESTLSISEGTYIEGGDSADNADQTRLDNVDGMDLEIVDTDTPSDEADDTPTDDSTPAETDTNPDNADQTRLDNVDLGIADTDIPSEPSTDQVEYADVPPTDDINTATVSHAPVNTTSTVSKGDYWASWKKFVEAIPTLSKEERDTYYQKYFKELSKLYQGEELGIRRVKLSNQYHYLIDKADTAFKPDPSAVINIPDTDDPMTWAEQFIICWAQKLRTNRLVYTKQKEYTDYYTGQLRQYLIDHNRATDGDLDRVEALMDQYLF